MSKLVSNKMDFKDLLGTYPLQIGVGNKKNKEIILDSLWNSGSRLIDLGCSYPGKNNDIINNFISNKQDFVLCQQLPLEDSEIFKKFGFHIYEASDSQLESVIDNIIQKQLENNNVDFYHIYLIHSIFSSRFFENIQDDINLYIRIFNILKTYKENGIIQHLGFSTSIDFDTLELFIFKLQSAKLINIVDVAMVPYNLLSYNILTIRNLLKLNVWDSPGLEGLELLKNNNFTTLCMTPFERGLISEYINILPELGYNINNISENAYGSLFNCEYLDYILLGTSSMEHLSEIYEAYNKFKNSQLNLI